MSVAKVSVSVRHALVVCAAALVALAWGQIGDSLLARWRSYQDAVLLLDTNGLVDHLLQAGQNFAFERGRTNVVLRGSAPISPADREFLALRRRAADGEMEAALAHLEARGRPDDQIRDGYRRLKALRDQVDAAMALPRPNRPPDLAEQWLAESSALVHALGEQAATPPGPERMTLRFGAGNRIKVLTYGLRDSEGLAATRISAAVSAGLAVDGGGLEAVMRLRGISDARWDALQREAGMAGSADFATQMQVVEEQIFHRYRPLQDEVLAAARTALASGARSPVSIGELTGASVPVLDGIARLLSIATADSEAHARANMDQARRALMLLGSLAVLVTLLGGGVLFILVRGFLAPLRRLEIHLHALAQGDTTISLPPSHHWTSEIDRMAGAAHVFRDALLERQRIASQLAERVAALGREVEEHRRTELALRRAEDDARATTARLQLVLDTTAEGILGIDGAGCITFANASAYDILGWPSDKPLHGRIADEALGHRVSDGSLCSPGNCFIRYTLADGRTCRIADEFFTGGRNVPHPVEYVMSPLMAGGSVAGAVMAFHDISARRALEAELQRSNAELEQFAYVASHDLRQPLRMISGFLGLLAKRLGGRLDSEDREFMDYAINGAKRMDALILGLLDYSRIGRLEEPAPMPLDPVVAEALENLAAAVAESGAEVTVAPLPTVTGNRMELMRLFQNLIGNAIKYRAADRSPRVTVGCGEHDGQTLLWVGDNGIGIDAAEGERVFGIFQRLVPQEQYEGTGIGLAICKKIVEHAGGRIWVESTPGQGSTFYFTLPSPAA